jgi:hypothetical protein
LLPVESKPRLIPSFATADSASEPKIGQLVRVNESVPLDKGRLARVVDRRDVRTNGRGIPLLSGHYQPMSSDEIPLRDDETGELFTVDEGCLDPVT